MVSAILSSVAGYALLSVLGESAKSTLGVLFKHLSEDVPASSSQGVEKLKILSDLKDVMMKIKGTLALAMNFQGNETVAHFLNKLKDVMYKAEDLKDDLDYLQLQRKVEEMNKTHASSSQSSEKNRLSSLNPLKLSQENILKEIRGITNQLKEADSNLMSSIETAERLKKFDKGEYYYFFDDQSEIREKRRTTSTVNEPKIYGRDEVIERLTNMLEDTSDRENVVEENISIIPIVGMGGIGKTTVAQRLFENQAENRNFDENVWICVSDKFDRLAIIRDIINSLSKYKARKFPHGKNLQLLETELKKRLHGKRILLVLDDVWSTEWRQLLAPLRSAPVSCAKIVITTRSDQNVLPNDKIHVTGLTGLDQDAYRLFFMKCAFGNDCPDGYPASLRNIAADIAVKLKGSPLAAKTVGRLLCQKLDEQRWRNVLNSSLWKSGTGDADDIMPALALSYYHLPRHLRVCFAFCSLFPKDYHFYPQTLVHMWIAQGYVSENENDSIKTEEMGKEYFDELVSRSFLERHQYSWSTGASEYFTMHDLLHDLAQLVSLRECYIYDGERIERIPETVGHLCVRSPMDISSMCEMKNLRTLVLNTGGLEALELEKLKSIRILILSDVRVKELPDAIGQLTHLRYLDLSHTSIKTVPESLCTLYHLRLLRLQHLQFLPYGVHNLINLQRFGLNKRGSSWNPQTQLFFPLDKHTGYELSRLKNMKHLSGELIISSLDQIKSKEEAEAAKLKEKSNLISLSLIWDRCTEVSIAESMKQVLDGLQPHPNLEALSICGYMGAESPDWFTIHTIPSIRMLELKGCGNWQRFAEVGQLPFLEELTLKRMNITIEAGAGADKFFPSLTHLNMKRSSISFEGRTPAITTEAGDGADKFFPSLIHLDLKMSSISFEGRTPAITTEAGDGADKLFPSLRKLYIERSSISFEGMIPAITSLEELDIRDSPGMDDQLPGFLNGLTSLTKLTLADAKLQRLPGPVMSTLQALQTLYIIECEELVYVKGLQALPCLQEIYIQLCSKLTSFGTEGTEERRPLMSELRVMFIKGCKNLECLPGWLPRLPYLEKLTIVACPEVQSLPDGGLPSSLRILEIIDCPPKLEQQLQQEWRMIQRIPYVFID